MDDYEIIARADELKSRARGVLMREVAGWVAVVTFVFGCLLGVLLAGDPDDQSALAKFLGDLPLFVVQMISLGVIGLLTAWIVNRVRSAKWYDTYGSAVEMGYIRDRLGGPDERNGDAQACALQFAANTLLVAIIILSFFLTQVA